MNSDIEEAIRRAESAASSAHENFITALAERVGLNANASAVFGDPVSHDGIMVVPVARVRWGFGGGAGSGEDPKGDHGQGAGGGGGVMASPLGFIEISNGRAEFRRVRDPGAYLPALLGGALAFWIAMRALRGLFR